MDRDAKEGFSPMLERVINAKDKKKAQIYELNPEYTLRIRHWTLNGKWMGCSVES